MKQSKFSESQMAILKEGDAGVPVAEILRKHGVSSATYYKGKSKYAGIEATKNFWGFSMACGIAGNSVQLLLTDYLRIFDWMVLSFSLFLQIKLCFNHHRYDVFHL